MKTIETVSIETTQFVFADFNRTVTNRPDLKKAIMDAKKVKEQIEVMKITEVPDGYCKFIDPKTGNEIQNINEDMLLVLDGQHRLSCVYQINEEEEQKADKILKERDLAIMNDTEVPDLYEPIQIENIDILVKDIEEIGDIRTYVIEKNNLCKKWAGNDFVCALENENPENEVNKAINKLLSLKFSASTIGLYLNFDKRTFSPSSITQHFKQNSEIDLPQWKRGIKLIMLFQHLGLPQTLLKSRYVIEMFIREQKCSDAQFNKLVKEFSQLSTRSIQDAMKLAGENAMNKLWEHMKEDNKSAVKNGDSLCTYYENISDEDINTFINDIPTDEKKTKSIEKKENKKGISDKELASSHASKTQPQTAEVASAASKIASKLHVNSGGDRQIEVVNVTNEHIPIIESYEQVS